MPVVLETGEIVTIFLSIDLKESLPEGAQVEIKLKKEGFISLPIPPGSYGGEPALEITLPEIDPTVGGLLSNGKFYAEIKFTTGGSTFACVWLRVKIA